LADVLFVRRDELFARNPILAAPADSGDDAFGDQLVNRLKIKVQKLRDLGGTKVRFRREFVDFRFWIFDFGFPPSRYETRNQKNLATRRAASRL
jgi:hypothetical protein